MYTYKIKIKKVSGRLNESILPSKNLVIKSNKSLSKKAILKEANAYFKKKYGLTVESLDTSNDIGNLITRFENEWKKAFSSPNLNNYDDLGDLVQEYYGNGISDSFEEAKDEYCSSFEEDFRRVILSKPKYYSGRKVFGPITPSNLQKEYDYLYNNMIQQNGDSNHDLAWLLAEELSGISRHLEDYYEFVRPLQIILKKIGFSDVSKIRELNATIGQKLSLLFIISLGKKLSETDFEQVIS